MSDTKTPAPRRVRARRVIALGTAAATSLAALNAAANDGLASGADAGWQLDGVQLAAAGGEGGEGGEGASAPRDADAAFLADLGLIEGHLRAGVALYEKGEVEMARTHMKHPGDEIYTGLAPKLEDRGAEGFADTLGKLAEAVESGADAEQVRTIFTTLLGEIEAARDAASADAKSRLMAIVSMSRTAAEEYAIGVVEGRIDNLHEYQDAWGFLQAGRAEAEEIAGAGDADATAAAEAVIEQIDIALGGFEGIVPPETIEGEASLLYGAAARMELAALEVK